MNKPKVKNHKKSKSKIKRYCLFKGTVSQSIIHEYEAEFKKARESGAQG
jgi:hypothetical protein